METTTPTQGKRETMLIEMDDESPIGTNSQTTDDSLSARGWSVDPIDVRTGILNDLNSNVVSPYKEPLPQTMDKHLAGATVDLVIAADDNEKVHESKEEQHHLYPLTDNSLYSPASHWAVRNFDNVNKAGKDCLQGGLWWKIKYLYHLLVQEMLC